MAKTHTLDPQAQALIDAARKARLVPLAALPIAEARARMRAAFLAHGEGPSVAAVEEMTIPGPLNGTSGILYRAKSKGEPLIVFIHGGGWILNDLATHDRLCRFIATSGEVSVLSLDHKRGPEWRYPIALDEMLRCWLYVANHRRDLEVADALGIMGDSSGGTLTLGVSQLALDLGVLAPTVQGLIYPVGDHFDAGRESYATRGQGYSLDRASMQWFWRGYLPHDWSSSDPYLFPLRRESFGGMPSTLIATAEFDPLRDEGLELAERLSADGVDVEAYHLTTQMHGFAMQTKNIERAAAFVTQFGQRMGAVLRGDSVRPGSEDVS